jgi:phage shock protein PspC (stress-responsive transcriptional regulator)
MSATTAERPPATATDYRPEGRRLSRSTDDRMLAGVAGGIARYLDVDVTLVRIGIAALTLLSGAGAVLYAAAWLLIPADGEDQSEAAAWITERRDRSR